MRFLIKLIETPAAISLCGWLLFYAGLFSVVGLVLLVGIVDDLTQSRDLPGRFGSALRAGFALAACASIVVYGWALRRWFAHFLSQARRYGLADVALTGLFGLALGVLVWLGLQAPAA